MFDNDSKRNASPRGQEQLPVATFQNSLRQWQARWQAQQAATPTAAVETTEPRTFKVRPRRNRKAVRPR